MRRLHAVPVVVLLLLVASCKQYVNPHVPVEETADLITEVGSPAAAGPIAGSFPAGDKRTRISLNNAPVAGEPVEQEIVQRMVEQFEKQNPDIRVEFSTWQFTPESFFERAKNRTLTDVIEVSAAQMPAIIQLNYAADLTENIAQAPAVQNLNPEAVRLFAHGRRVFGLPAELHTMALFYNRRLIEEGLNPKPVETKKADDSKKDSPEADKDSTVTISKKKKQSKGADADPRDFSDMEKPPIVVAQFWRRKRPTYEQQEEERTSENRRGRQEVQDYFNVPVPEYDERGRRINRSRPQQQQPQQQYYQDPQQQYYDPYAQPTPVVRKKKTEETEQSRQKAEPTDEDILTSEAEAGLADADTIVQEPVTTVVETMGMPDDWEAFIKLAVKMTDHEKGVYGYAPILFAKEGGREFSQWAVQTGLQIETTIGNTTSIDVNTSKAADVAQFMKDLRWRYDVMPPVDKCYSDNLLRMFAAGKIAMMTLPATKDMISRLLKLGMTMDEIGITALPAGVDNRRHLTFGRGYIINTQLDRNQRVAAFKWILYQLDPETRRMREQLYFREQEYVGAPEVPLYANEQQTQYVENLKWFRNIPVYAGYERVVTSNLQLEPPYFPERLFEAISEGVRPIIEQQNSRPDEMIKSVGVAFENKYLRNAPTPEGFKRYLQLIGR